MKNHSNEHVGPIDYVALLLDKAHAGSVSLIGQIQGSLSTHEKQLEKREEMANAVHQQMIDRNFSACRGCHDVEKMYNPAKPMVQQIHRGMGPEAEKRVDCLSCHPTAGHNYGYVISFTQEKAE